MFKTIVLLLFLDGFNAMPTKFDLSVGFHLSNDLGSVPTGRYSNDYLTEDFSKFFF